MTYVANENRYSNMEYVTIGNSGLKLPKLSLGLWHNFGGVDDFENSKNIILEAFNNGITHIDIANNYGPPAGSAEATFAKVLHNELSNHRDELVISTKAGYWMWNGPYGDGGSKKYLVSSLDQSLRRMKLDYVDIFYHHRFDPETPLEETMGALEQLYRQGKTLYIGISNYNAEQTQKAVDILTKAGVPILINQFKYSMLHREPEQNGLLNKLSDNKIGSIAFSPLAQGILTDRYLQGIPNDSRASKPNSFLKEDEINRQISIIKSLQTIAQSKNISIAELAISWLWEKGVDSVLIGASSVQQLQTNLKALRVPKISKEELAQIQTVLRM